MTASLASTIRTVPDFPKPGIRFRDITTLLNSPEAFHRAADALVDHCAGMQIDAVVGIESRGFVFGSILAYRLGAGFVPVRKPGKLPAETIRQEYALEYGTDALEIHRDALRPGQRVLVHDDLLATGGTVCAACALVDRLGATLVGASFLIELSFLEGRKRLPAIDVFSLVQYASE
jgi:adenine phosphoribosyltransferase